MAQQYTEQDIVTADALEHMRNKASMYLGDIQSAAGHLQLLKEVIDNAVDEAAGLTEFNTVTVSLHRYKNTYQVVVIDEGRGVPLGSLKQAFMDPRSTGKDSDAYNTSAGIFGMGVKAVLAMSKKMSVVTSRAEGAAVLDVEDLQCKKYNQSKVNQSDRTGTAVFYQPDPACMRECETFLTDENISQITDMCETVSAMLPNTCFRIYLWDEPLSTEWLAHKGKNLWKAWTDVRKAVVSNICLLETNPSETLFDLFRKRNGLSDDEVIVGMTVPREFDGKLGYDINLVYTDRTRLDMKTIGSVNRTPIHKSDSHHLSGLYQAIKEQLAPFIEDRDIREFFQKRYQLPLAGTVSVFYPKAVFIGQTKTDFKDRDFLNLYIKDLRKALKEFGEEFWSNLYSHLAEHIELMFHQYYNKGSAIGTLKNVGVRLNNYRAYNPCRLTDPDKIELFIAEGDSAGGQVSQVVDKDNQAVFRMRGKILNSVQAPTSRLRQDKVIQDLETVTGVRVAAPDLSTFNFKRINILTDADADGHHITALLVGLFYRMNPDLLEHGHVYVITPPLYKLEAGKHSMYLRDETAMMDVKTRSIYSKAIQIRLNTVTGASEVLEGDDFRSFCCAVDRVGGIIEKIANHLVVEPLYLELMAHCIDCLDRAVPDTETMRQRLGYDDVQFEPISQAVILSQGDVDVTVPLTGLVEALKAYILPELEYLRWRQIDIRVTTKLTDVLKDRSVTLYQLYQIFKQLDKLFSVTRHKGLGEMTHEDLRISSIDPDTRTAMQVGSIGDVDRLFELLGVQTEARKKL